MTTKKFYITTAIDYVNAEPHIGHAYQKIIADTLSRWNKLLNKDVFFLTGTDEHGKKIANSAEQANLSPKEFTNKMSEKFKQAWETLNIKYDRFIRTTDKDHKKVVTEFTKKVNEAGDIYKGEYEGYYCVPCETYYTEKDSPDLICPIHKKPLEKLKEETYFFRLSKYQSFLLDLYEKHPEFILPKARRLEVINRIKEGLNDLSITRTSIEWGIPFPLDKKHVFYVWYEALINYYTATRRKGKEKFWPANLHILGKDNTWFHTVIWPAMLKSANLQLPKSVFNHGFLTFNGQKISKSLGNTISPITLTEKYPVDTIRYFCLRNFPFGEDGDFSEETLKERHNNELANKLGNLISRVSALAEKYSLKKTKNRLNLPEGWKKVIKEGRAALEVIPEDKNLDKQINLNRGSRAYILRVKEKRKGDPLDYDLSEHNDLFGEAIRLFVENLINNYEFDKALNLIFELIDHCNWYIQIKKPWETHNSQVLYEASNAIKDIAILLSPFMPETSEKIAKTFNFEISLKSLNSPLKPSKIKKSDILFKKI